MNRERERERENMNNLIGSMEMVRFTQATLGVVPFRPSPCLSIATLDFKLAVSSGDVVY